MTETRHAPLALHPVTRDDGSPVPDLVTRQQVARRAKIAAAVVAVLLAIGAGRTVMLRQANAEVLAAQSRESTRQFVTVAQPERAARGSTLALPGTLQGQQQAPIAARATGYLKRWHVDIGSRVARGTLLAEIDSPELDQQLIQAGAAREQAASSLALARQTAERWEGLRRKDVVSQQDLEERRSAVAQSEANLAAAEANVQRLRQLSDFKRVTAPFSGVVTRRNIEVGDLIDPSRVLFTLAETRTLRLYVNVPQAYASLVKPGQPVTVTQAELRNRRFQGKVVRTAGAIDATTRTLQVEVALPNPEGTLLPGAYVQVSLPLAAGETLTAPSATLLFRAEGSLVGVVDAEGKVALRKVSIGRNDGVRVELLEGVSEGDRIVMNPPDWLADGQTVVVATGARAARGAGPGASAATPGASGSVTPSGPSGTVAPARAGGARP